jgi:hypothetical protein
VKDATPSAQLMAAMAAPLVAIGVSETQKGSGA